MRTELRQSTHTVPFPMASEQGVVAHAAECRARLEAGGGRIVSETRVRNTTFDKRGEKTTTVFVVEWFAGEQG